MTGSVGQSFTENLVASGDFAIVLNNLLFWKYKVNDLNNITTISLR